MAQSLHSFIDRFLNVRPIWVAAILFFALFAVGMLSFKDFGIAWDEHSQREIGTVSYNFLRHGDNTLHSYHDKDYGVAFELPLVGLERVFNVSDSRQVYFMRHAATYLSFLVCLWFGFWLIVDLYKNPWVAAVGVLMIAMHPVLFGHAFFNSKDIPFMGMYLVCFFMLNRAFSRQSLLYFVLTGVTLGILINMRIMGVLLLLIVLFFLVIDAGPTKAERKTQLSHAALLLLAFWTTLYFSWPYLYENAPEHLANAFSNMSKFRFNRETLYLGSMVKPDSLPWHYALVWIHASTPVVFLGVCWIGAGTSLVLVIRKISELMRPSLNRNLAIYLACFAAPILAVILFGSVLYDSWRHLFFVYPPFVLLGVFGLNEMIGNRHLRLAVPVLVFLGLTVAAWHIYAHHPHGHVYFNALFNRSAKNHERQLFETDYWGLSYREGIESVLTADKRNTVSIQMGNPPGEYNLEILSKGDRQRIQLSSAEADYIVADYRWNPAGLSFPNYTKVDSVVVQNNEILSVFRKNTINAPK